MLTKELWKLAYRELYFFFFEHHDTLDRKNGTDGNTQKKRMFLRTGKNLLPLRGGGDKKNKKQNKGYCIYKGWLGNFFFLGGF